jgi:hypothetical protein
MFSVQLVLTNSGTGFSVQSAQRLYNATLVVPNEESSGCEEVNAVTVLVQLRVNNSHRRSMQTKQRIRTRSTEENEVSL